MGKSGAVQRETGQHGATVLVKIDGDGQMDPALINRFDHDRFRDEADYNDR